jgi:hypothetical protein
MNNDAACPGLLWFNTLFDLSLSGEDQSRHAEAGAALSVAALLCCREGDEALLDAGVDGGYTEWLEAHGFSPRVACPDRTYAGYRPVPWGWNREAEERFASLGCVGEHPPFDAVRRANSRELSNRVAASLGSPSAGRIARSRAELAALLDPAHFPYVVKPCHGSAGSGFTIVTDAPSVMRAVDRSGSWFSKSVPVSVERWLDRIDDYSANFTVEENGLSSFTCQRAFIDPKGIFRGIDICTDFPLAYESELRHAAGRAAEELLAAGYTGPAGIDAFSWRDGDSVSFNPICEINARHTIGVIARSMKRILGGECGRTLLVVAGGAELPREMSSLSALFGGDAYDVRTKKGVFPSTPAYLERDGNVLTAKRFLVYIAGDSHEECGMYESRMRDVLASLRPARRNR